MKWAECAFSLLPLRLRREGRSFIHLLTLLLSFSDSVVVLDPNEVNAKAQKVRSFSHKGFHTRM